MIELALLNAIIAKKDFSALVRHGIANASHFREQSCAFNYIRKHMKEFGEMPSVESVVANCKDFEIVDVAESIDTLALKLIEKNLKLEEKQLLTDLAKGFGEMDANQVLDELRTRVNELSEKSMRKGRNGVDWSMNGAERLKEYESRKDKDFTKKIPSFFEEFTKAGLSYERGSVITAMAFTGKGKSWIALLQALEANRAGFKVLIESAEMSKEENQFRLDTLEGGFSNRGLWTGQLDNVSETHYRTYLEKFSKGSGRSSVIIKTPEDWSEGLSLQQLEYDIDRSKCDLVIIDQFNLMKFGGSHRDDKAALSRQLKQLAAKKGVCVFLLYQTNGDYEKSASKGEDGIRELKLPTLANYSETIAVIQDSNIVFALDTVTFKDPETGRSRGKALCGVAKSRQGSEGIELELDWLPNDGVIRPRQATDVF